MLRVASITNGERQCGARRPGRQRVPASNHCPIEEPYRPAIWPKAPDSRPAAKPITPASVIDRLEKAEKPGEEGKKLCIELIAQVREIAGVHGVHVMAYRREHLVEKIIEESGILKERLGESV